MDSPLEGDGFEPSVPRESSLLLPRSELARRNRLAAGTGCRRQQWRRAGTAPICGSAFWRVRMPSGRVSRWPQPALFAQYSQVRQVSTE
jgi:hypothetical protein